MKRSPSLDVVRGIAILMVLIWHYFPRNETMPNYYLLPTRLFWSGVDMFFVLSGFLIAGILLQNLKAENYFKAFYLRRAARIVPLYLVLFLSYVVMKDLNVENMGRIFRESLPMWNYLTFTQNFAYGARDAFSDPWIDVTWSLAVEEQFYIVLSLLVRYLNKKWLTALSVLLIIAAPVLRYFSPALEAYVFPLQRADSLMLGVLLAIIWHSPRGQEFLKRFARIFVAALPVLLAGYIWLTIQDAPVGDAFGHFWLALFYADFLLVALTVSTRSSEVVFKNPLLIWLGLRSYGIYLLHKPVYFSVVALVQYYALPVNLLSGTLIRLAALVFIVEISYRYFEKPILDFAQQHFKYIKAGAAIQSAN